MVFRNFGTGAHPDSLAPPDRSVGERRATWQPPVKETRGRRLSRRLLFAVTLVLIGLAIYISTLVIRQRNAADDASRSELTWIITQSVADVARLEAAVGNNAIEATADSRDEVQLWLDLVSNRAKLLSEGEVWDYIRSHPEMVGTVRALRNATTAAQPLVDRIDRPGVARQLMAMLLPLNFKLAQLSALAFAHNSEAVTAEGNNLNRLHWEFSGALLLLILCSLGLIVMVRLDNWLLSNIHREMQALIGELRQTGAESLRINTVLSERDLELHLRNNRFDAALSNMSQALCMFDADRRLIVCNMPFVKLFGIDAGAARPGTSLSNLMSAISLAGSFSKSGFETFSKEERGFGAARRSGTFSHEDSNGRTLSVTHQTMSDGGWVATYEELTEQRRVAARISYLAQHDALTGLPNRLKFHHRLSELLAAMRSDADGFSVLCVDLDHFKTINETLGHAAGDRLLEIVTSRLQHCASQGDLIARLGSDEFAILLQSADESEAAQLARRVIETLCQPYDLLGQRAVISASIGIARSAFGMTDADDIIKHADTALREAKKEGDAAFRFFAPEMDVKLQARRKIELDLRDALANQQLEVFYQPIVDLASNRQLGFEALLRWQHPVRGMVSPVDFIPIAEELGLIEEIGRWVLRQACADAQTWPDLLRVSVNLSPLQFKGDNAVESVIAALHSSGLAPDRLDLEVTESVLLLESDSVVKALHQLRDLGVHVTLDDFGTGYSSLSYLRSFPFEKIKIDQSFIRQMPTRPDCRTIVNAITSLAHQLGMRATAEGVETSWQLDQVRDAGCNEVQGYFYSRPMPSQDVPAYLQRADEALAAALADA